MNLTKLLIRNCALHVTSWSSETWYNFQSLYEEYIRWFIIQFGGDSDSETASSDDSDSDHDTDDGVTSDEDPGSDLDYCVCSCED